MHLRTAKAPFLALFAASGALVSVLAACGDTIVNNNTNCGAGTTLQNGTCVVLTDATADVVQPTTDGGADVAPDTFDPDAEDPTPDDPCPGPAAANEAVVNCDPACGAVNPSCAKSFCAVTDAIPRFTLDRAEPPQTFLISTERSRLDPEMLAVTKVTVRLPRNTVVDHLCQPMFSELPSLPGPAIARMRRPRFMMLVTNTWSVGLGAQYPSSRGVVLPGRYAVQLTHSRRLDAAHDVPFDVMPAAGAFPFQEHQGCTQLPFLNVLLDEYGEPAPPELNLEPPQIYADKRGFSGTYIFTDKRLAATNVEFRLASPSNPAPVCP